MDEIKYYLGIKRKPWGIRAIVYDKGVKILKERKYSKISKIGSGGYGDVVKLRTPGKKKIIMAAKIISSFARSPGESELWKNFDHPNILPLLDIIQEPEVDIYFMPLLKKSLDKALLEDSFRLDEKAFEITKTWMKDVSKGLEHLHAMNIAHLDLKIDNVLIDAKMSAVICDFSCTAVMDKKIESYGLTKYFRPPEVCSSLGKMIPVNGREFDAWSYGMLAHYTWTRVMPIDGNEVTEYWIKVAYPAMFDSLKVSNFRSSLQENFPKSIISDQDLIHSLNLLKGTLRYDAGSRPLISEIIRHPLIKASQYGASLLEVDDIWTWKTDLKVTGENVISKSDMESITNEITEKGDIPDNTDDINIKENTDNFTPENMKEFNGEFNEAKEKKSFHDLDVEGKVTLESAEDKKVVQSSSTTEEDTPALVVPTDSETLADVHLTSHSEEEFQGTREEKQKFAIFSKAWFKEKFRLFRKA